MIAPKEPAPKAVLELLSCQGIRVSADRTAGSSGLKCRPIEVEYFLSYPLTNYQLQMIAPKEPAPKAVLELLSCQCKRVRQLPSCTRLANGLHCTGMCRLEDCTNQPEEATEDLIAVDSDVE